MPARYRCTTCQSMFQGVNPGPGGALPPCPNQTAAAAAHGVQLLSFAQLMALAEQSKKAEASKQAEVKAAAAKVDSKTPARPATASATAGASASAAPAASVPAAAAAPASAAPAAAAPAPMSAQVLADIATIKKAIAEMPWLQYGVKGPTVVITTSLKSADGQRIHQYFMNHYDDVLIHAKPLRLYYYVGTLGVNWGKGGFRISGHTRQRAKVGNASTYGVLHIANAY